MKKCIKIAVSIILVLFLIILCIIIMSCKKDSTTATFTLCELNTENAIERLIYWGDMDDGSIAIMMVEDNTFFSTAELIEALHDIIADDVVSDNSKAEIKMSYSLTEDGMCLLREKNTIFRRINLETGVLLIDSTNDYYKYLHDASMSADDFIGYSSLYKYRFVNVIPNLDTAFGDYRTNVSFAVINGQITSDGQIMNTDKESYLMTSDYIDTSELQVITRKTNNGFLLVAKYDSNNKFISLERVWMDSPVYIDDCNYIKLCYTYYDNNIIVSESELKEDVVFWSIRQNPDVVINSNPAISKSIDFVEMWYQGEQYVTKVIDIEDIKTKIDSYMLSGIDEFNLSCHVTVPDVQKDDFLSGRLDEDELYPVLRPSAEYISDVIEYITSVGAKVNVLQVHNGVYKTALMNNMISFDEFKKIYDFEVDILLNELHIQPTYVGLFNEIPGYILVERKQDVMDSVKKAQEKTKVGLSGVIVEDIDLCECVDVFLPHHYGKNILADSSESGLNDAIRNERKNPFWSRVAYLKKQYHDTPIVLSEFGVQSYWECLEKPENWTDDLSLYSLDTEGGPQIYYLEVMMPLIKELGIENCSYWWPLYGNARTYISEWNQGEVLK